MNRWPVALLLLPLACSSTPRTDAGADAPAPPTDTPPLDAPADALSPPPPDAALDAPPDGADVAPPDGGRCAEGEAPVGGVCGTIAAPRPVAPLSVARVSSHRPWLRWALPAGVTGAVVEVCADRACATVEQRFEADGASGRPPTALPPGTHFWRLAGRVGGRAGRATSATWELAVGRRDVDVDASWAGFSDFNGDGRADLAVGGREAEFPAGATIPAVSVFHGPLRDGATPAARFRDGASVGRLAAMADVNGDGFSDLASAATFFLGGAAGLRPAPTSPNVGAGGAPFTPFGALLATTASAGDVNGDGYGDVVAVDGGRARVVLGGAEGFTAATTPAIPAFTVAAGWDVNHDGYADLVVGAREADGVGAVAVYLGGAGGVAGTAAQVMRGSDELGRDFGASLVNAGDVNGDGFADLAVSATMRSGTVTGDLRRVHVYFGGASGLATTPAVTLIGSNAFPSFGDAMAAAGDVSGDGYDDLAVRGPRGASDDGYVYVFMGGAEGPHRLAVQALSAACEDGYFGISLTGAGDLDGDGYDDVAVGQPGASSSPMCFGGRVLVFTGRMAGIDRGASTTLRTPENPLRLSGYVIDRFGQAVAGRP